MPHTKSNVTPARNVLLFSACMSLLTLAASRPLVPAGDAAPGHPRSGPEAGVGVNGDGARAGLLEAYGRLPLRFEANRGQAGGEAKFISRVGGYTLLLTRAGAVLRLRKEAGDEADTSGAKGDAPAVSTLRLGLEGANRSPKIVPLDELSGRSNYFVGAGPRGWLTGIPNYTKVKYESVYRGIDLVYYGSDGRLEYDFIVAPGADPSRIRLRFDGARAARLDEGGDLILITAAGDVRQKRPVAYQTVGGERREVASRYVKGARGRFRIEVGEYDRTRPLVIDPVIIYSTYVGVGTGRGRGVAVDSSGSAYVVGTTFSANFDSSDAFVAKLSPDGRSFVYAVYLGGDGGDSGNAVAVDSSGNAYVAGQTHSENFPRTAGVIQGTSGGGGGDAFAAKLNPAGSALVYSTYLGGEGNDHIAGIAIDASGAAYVGGTTGSFKLANFPSDKRVGDPVFLSTDAAAHWTPSGDGIAAAGIFDFAVAQGSSGVVYAATAAGVYKSADGGASWQLTGAARPTTAPAQARCVAVDPSNPNVVYAGNIGLYKSTDGGALYELKANALSHRYVFTLAVDPATPTTLYAGTDSGLFKSTNGGDDWVSVLSEEVDPRQYINKLVIDPADPRVIYAATWRGVLKSTNGGAGWAAVNNGIPLGEFTSNVLSLSLDPAHPSTLYAGLRSGGVFKSTDGGASWAASNGGLTVTIGDQTYTPSVNALLVDPALPSTVYAGLSEGGVFRSTDGGASWTASNSGQPSEKVSALAARGTGPATIFVGTSVGGDAFVAKLNPAGSRLEYLRRVGGADDERAGGVAVDADGSAYVTGETSSRDFPAVNAFQQTRGGLIDAFVAKINPAGAAFVYSTRLGGNRGASGAGIAVGQGGEAYVTGHTFSTDFPVVNALQPVPPQSGNAFLTKFAPDGRSLVYSTYIGGSSIDKGLAVAVRPDGSAYVAGTTWSEDFPASDVPSIAPRRAPGAGFLSRVSPAGSALTFSTRFGASANGVAVDASGGVYIVGENQSGFPLVNPASADFDTIFTKAFAAKFGPGVDIALSMTDSHDPVPLGSDLRYTIRVSNDGDFPATGVTLTDELPMGATLVSAETSHGSCSGGATVTCNVGALGVGEAATVTITVRPPAATYITNTAAVTLNEAETFTGNNSATENTSIEFADISVSNAVMSGTVAPGSKVVYVVTASIQGGISAQSVKLTDELPPELTFVSCVADRGTCGGSGNSRSVTFHWLSPLDSAHAVIIATVSPSAAVGTVISNTASASATGADPNPSNNAATASFTVGPHVASPKSNGKIAYTGAGGFEGKYVAVVDPDGNNNRHLAGGYTPAWSSDGAKIAVRSSFSTPRGTYEHVNVINPEGFLQATVTSGAHRDAKPTWSPSGEWLAFVGSDFSIYVAKGNGLALSKLVSNKESIHGLDWSPDGERFAFIKDNSLFVMDVDGSNQRQLTTRQTERGLASDSAPDWSPDGTKILFTRSTAEGRDAFVINADGTGLARLFNHQGANAATWSPDGTKVAFESGRFITVANTDGSGVTTDIAEGAAPSWQPLPNANPTPTPAPVQTFKISGRVTPPDPAAPSSVRLSGTRTATIKADAEGDYTFFNLPKGGTYTITPLSDTARFTPGSRTVADLQKDETNLDFAASNVLRSIGGRVTDSEGRGLAGVGVALLRGDARRGTTTDADGRYSFPDVVPGGTYSVVPSLPSFSFDPVRADLPPVLDDTTVNFVGAPSGGVRSIRGRVGDLYGGPIAGLRVALGGARSAVVKTSADGTFTFRNLPVGKTYTVRPSTAEGFTFSVPERNFHALDADQSADFAATTGLPFARFDKTSASVMENAQSVELTVTRYGDASAEASLDYETSELTASERSDYTASFGTLRFGRGESVKTLKLLITDDNLPDGERVFSVKLTGGTWTRIIGADTVTVTVKDDDGAGPAENLVESSRFFVAQHYKDFLSREHDAEGLDFWTGEIERCGADAHCREVKRINVSAAFFLSIEFQQTGYLVYLTHTGAFGTGERLRLRTFLRDAQEIGRGVVVGQGEWRARLEANKRAFFDDFVQRPEFAAAYPATMPPAHFVELLNANTGGSLTQAERDSLAAALAGGTATRAEVLRAVAEDADFSRREFTRAFVLMQYFGYLRRGPADPPDSDLSGWQFWLSKLDHFKGNFVEAEMVKAFITSTEYRQRFGR